MSTVDETAFPGKTNEQAKRFELGYWETIGVAEHELHLPTYQQGFPLEQISYESETVLDVGSGAISIFENVAPADAKVTPFDILAGEYNQIAPEKKFPIRDVLSPRATFSLVTVFNMLDHVDDADDILQFIAANLAEGGRVWLAVHLYRPHGEEGHPQKFTCKSIVDLLDKYFSIESVSIIREGVPLPYMWCGILSHKGKTPGIKWRAIIKGFIWYYAFQIPRIYAKAMKMIGLRSVLPQRWKF